MTVKNTSWVINKYVFELQINRLQQSQTIVKCSGICQGKPGSIGGHATRSNGAWHEKLTVIYTNNDGPVEITCYNTDESISALISDYNDKSNAAL